MVSGGDGAISEVSGEVEEHGCGTQRDDVGVV